MKRTKIELLLVCTAWMVLVGGIMLTILVSKGFFESQIEMAFPQALLTLVGGVGFSVVAWALLMQVVRMSDRLRKLEEKIEKL